MNAFVPAAALLCVSLSLHVASAQPSRTVGKTFAHTLTATELKQAYLACDRASSASRLGMSEAFQCSVVHEELKQRVFGGDFNRLLSWWRLERSNPEARAATSPAP